MRIEWVRWVMFQEISIQVKHTSEEIWTHQIVPGHTKNVRGTPARKMVKAMIYRCDANGLLDNGNDWDNEPTGMTMELEQGRTLVELPCSKCSIENDNWPCQLIIENKLTRAIWENHKNYHYLPLHFCPWWVWVRITERFNSKDGSQKTILCCRSTQHDRASAGF